MTKQELIEKIDKDNLVQSIYKLHEELTSMENVKLCCRKGCSLCCNQLVPCSKLEWDEIEKFVTDNNIKDEILERNKGHLTEWIKYRTENYDDIMNGIKDPLREWQGKHPCIFLKNDDCQIYPVRPMNCRAMTSTVYYITPNGNKFCGGIEQRWNYERYLNEIFMEKGGCTMVLDDFIFGFHNEQMILDN